MATSYFDPPTSGFDDETVGQQLSKILSPTSASELVGPPPDSAPVHRPGESTPLTGSLARPPQQAIAKNLDKPESLGSYNTPQNLTGVSSPPDGGNVRSIVSPVQAQPVRPAQPIQQAQPLQQPVRPALMNPDPNASLRPGGNGIMPALPASPTQVQGPSRLDLAQNRLAQLTNQGPGWSQIKNPIGRVAAGIGNAALTFLDPRDAANTPGTTGHNQQLIGRQTGTVNNLQGQQQAAATLADTASQTQLRAQEAAKNTALAQADAPFKLSAAQAEKLGDAGLEGEPMTQRVFGQLSAAHERAAGQIATGAGHDAAKITATGMNNATSTANTAAHINSAESIADARDKTQMLLGQLRSSTSRANNADTNQTHLTTSGLRAGGGSAGQPGSYKVPTDVTKRAALGSNVIENADAVEEILSRRGGDILGPAMGRFTNVQQMIGSDDPDIAALGARIHNIALASNGAHGLRSQEAIAKTENALINGFHNGPNAVRSALNATTSSVQTFINDEKNFRQTGGRVPPANTGGGVPAGNIRVQLPDGRSGHISAGQKDQFLKDHPGAKVL